MSIVVDASVLVSALLDTNATGIWAIERLKAHPVAAPHLVTVEATHALRRVLMEGRVSHDTAALAYADLLEMHVELYPFRPFADRVWELRDTVTAYDAWYVALAEALGTPLATLDKRLANAPGPTCRFETPPFSHSA